MGGECVTDNHGVNELVNPIVASSAGLAPVQGRAWRLWLSVALIVLVGFASLWRALQEPSTGYRFSVDGQGHVRAAALTGAGVGLQEVRAISAGGHRVAIDPAMLTESGGIINRYQDQQRFYAAHRELAQVLATGLVGIEHAQGVTQATVTGKPLEALGLRFWFPWFVGLLSLSVGLGLWMHSPRRGAAWCYLLSSAGYAFIMLMIAPSSSRLLTQPPLAWQELHMASHVAAFVQNGALAVLLWNYPSRLGGRGFVAALVLWSLAWLGIDFLELVPTISIGFRLPIALFGLLFIGLFVLQWRAARGDPVKRAQLKWLILLFSAGLSVVFVAYVYGASGAVITFPQSYGLATISLLYLGLVPLVTRVGLFQLEEWWVRAWLWFLGGLTVVALDLMFVGLLSVGYDSALLLALALGGWVYFPLRQWAWRRLWTGAHAHTRDLLPDIVALASQGTTDLARGRKDWMALWDRVFEPVRMEEWNDDTAQARIEDQGRRLIVPGGQGLPSLALTLAVRGQRLFTLDDARRCDEITRLTLQSLRTQAAVEASVRQERARIASDLHDDLGAMLLTIAHTGDPALVPDLARQALDEMRLSVRGLMAAPAHAADVLADWRAESVQRLGAAGFSVDWQAGEPPDGLLLPARARLQLTRVLREALSNVIQHSRGRHCRVLIGFPGEALTLSVEDDGCGMDFAADLGNR